MQIGVSNKKNLLRSFSHLS